tara:strand:+ start:4317 stop:4958 length:642 start_codon:yes stop_codon:yes gene_type:complete
MLNLIKGFVAPNATTNERESFTVVSNYFNALDTIRGNEDHFIYEGNLINSIKDLKGKRKEKRMNDLNLYKYTKHERHYLGKIAGNKKAFIAYIASYPTDTRLPSFETIYNNSVKEFDENGKKKPSQPKMVGDKKQVRNSNPKSKSENVETEKVETLEQAIETCITMLLEFNTTEAELATLVTKSLQSRASSRKLKMVTTSNKSDVFWKLQKTG